MRFHWSRLFLTLAFSLPVGADDDLSVLSPDKENPPAKMLKSYLLQQAQRHFDQRRDEIAALKSADDVAARQRRLRENLRQALGDWPERTPLNPQVVGRIPRDGFTIEKVIYESRPQHHVTANLYIPHGAGPFPGVLMPIGHSVNGKAADYMQRGASLLAQNGMVALVYDPIGQGERMQLLGDDGRPAVRSSTNEHSLTGIGALLVGRSTASYRIWDGMRSLDFLASRPEVDPTRLGCTGCSGGGTLTSYLMALDERIVAAAPSCYITSLERLFATIGPQDAEQNIPGQVAFGMEHADYLLLHSPQPTLICAATQDFFDIAGTRTTFQEAQGIYALLGVGDRVAMIETDTKHGYPKSHREAAASWMRRWLLKDDTPVVETEIEPLPDRELQCTTSGQVLADLKGKSVFDLNAKQADHLAEARPTPASYVPIVRRLLALPESIPAATSEGAGTIERDGYRIEKRIYTTEPGIVVPALLYTPTKPSSDPTIVFVSDRGKEEADRDGTLPALAAAGRTVLALDLRGWGETAPGKLAEQSYFGNSFSESFLALHLSRPLLGQRVFDALSVVESIAKQSDGGIELHGRGAGGLVALHAAILDERIVRAELQGTLQSWHRVVQSPVSYEQLDDVVPGVLAHYDLPDLAAAMGEKRLKIRHPVDPQGQPLPKRE